tara:strand:- start:19770 stop:19964 length:195 start_codon:yes stop_codon:yes gene_type:complete
MITHNLYKILGVDANVDTNTIKNAYRRLASKYHPDKNLDNTDSKQHFIEIKDAYEKIMAKRKYE